MNVRQETENGGKKMTNREILKDIKGEYGYNKQQAISFIASRAQIVASLAGLTYCGLTTQKGILFMYGRNIGIGQAMVKSTFFSFETVLDTPSILINWKRELDKRD